MKLVIGLGNPGKKYAHTRHNIGWDAVTAAAEEEKALFSKKANFKAEVAPSLVDDVKVWFVRPLTFMNLSGEAVRAIKQYYKVELKDILVVQDEMDFDEGKMAFSFASGAGGHNGIASIVQELGSKEFARLRIGIGRPPEKMDPADYVLQKPAGETDLKDAAKAILDWVATGTGEAMNKWNRN